MPEHKRPLKKSDLQEAKTHFEQAFPFTESGICNWIMMTTHNRYLDAQFNRLLDKVVLDHTNQFGLNEIGYLEHPQYPYDHYKENRALRVAFLEYLLENWEKYTQPKITRQ